MSDRRRYSAALGVAVLTLGAVGVLGTGSALLLASRGVRRAWISAVGVVVATTAAVVAPWPLATTWPGWAAAMIALTVSGGTGLVLGALYAGVRTRRPAGAEHPDSRAPVPDPEPGSAVG